MNSSDNYCSYCMSHQFYKCVEENTNCLICLEPILHSDIYLPFTCEISECQYTLHMKCFRKHCFILYENQMILPNHWKYHEIIRDIHYNDGRTPIHRCLICKHYTLHKYDL